MDQQNNSSTMAENKVLATPDCNNNENDLPFQPSAEVQAIVRAKQAEMRRKMAAKRDGTSHTASGHVGPEGPTTGELVNSLKSDPSADSAEEQKNRIEKYTQLIGQAVATAQEVLRKSRENASQRAADRTWVEIAHVEAFQHRCRLIQMKAGYYGIENSQELNTYIKQNPKLYEDLQMADCKANKISEDNVKERPKQKVSPFKLREWEDKCIYRLRLSIFRRFVNWLSDKMPVKSVPYRKL